MCFKENVGKGYFTFFGMHRSWKNTWKEIYRLNLDKNRKYLYGGSLDWKALLYIFAPFRIFKNEIQNKVE